MSFLGISFSQLGAFWARAEVHSHIWSHLANTGLVTGTNIVCFGVFFMLKLMVFNKIFHVNKLERLEEHLTLEEKAALKSSYDATLD
jgi:hypothetical protein